MSYIHLYCHRTGKITALKVLFLKVKNDILLRLHEQHVTLLILLDLSAAFDTVNHTILSSFFVSWISVIQRLSGSSRAHRVVVSVYPSVVACLRGLISPAGFLKALLLDHSSLPYTGVRWLMLYTETILRQYVVTRTTHNCMSPSLISKQWWNRRVRCSCRYGVLHCCHQELDDK